MALLLTEVADPGDRGPGTSAAAAARELAAQASRLLRVRRGELAEPSSWESPELRGTVADIAAQLVPIRSRAALASSFAREAGRGDALVLAYAATWLDLDRRRTSITTRRRQARAARRVRGRG